MRRSFRTRVSFSGWIPRVGTLGWYAMPHQGMGFPTRLRQVPEKRWARGGGAVTGNRVAGGGIVNAVVDWLPWSFAETLERDAPRWGHGRGIGNVIFLFALDREVNQLPCRALIRRRRLAALKGHRIPAQGNALGTASQRIGVF